MLYPSEGRESPAVSSASLRWPPRHLHTTLQIMIAVFTEIFDRCDFFSPGRGLPGYGAQASGAGRNVELVVLQAFCGKSFERYFESALVGCFESGVLMHPESRPTKVS